MVNLKVRQVAEQKLLEYFVCSSIRNLARKHVPNCARVFEDYWCFAFREERPLKIHLKSSPVLTAESPGGSEEKSFQSVLESKPGNEKVQ